MHLKNIAIGIFCVIIGVYTVIDTYRKPDSQFTTRTVGGYIGGIGAIILGVMLIFETRDL